MRSVRFPTRENWNEAHIVHRNRRGNSVAMHFVRRGRIVIGGKIFTESYILGEMAAQTIESSSQVPSPANSGWEARAYYSRFEERRHRPVPGLHGNAGGGHSQRRN